MSTRLDLTSVSSPVPSRDPTRLTAPAPFADAAALIASLRDLETLDAAFAVFLDGLPSLAPGVGAAAIFRIKSGSLLEPVVHRTFRGGRFTVARQLMRQAVDSGEFVHELLAARTETGESTLEIAVAPLSIGETARYLLQCETRVTPGSAPGLLDIGRIAAIFVPAFERLEIRAQTDAWYYRVGETILESITAKDTYTAGHSQRVAKFALAIGDALGLGRDERRDLYVSGLCHDVGKIGVAEVILRKPGMLSVEEYDEMKSHPEVGNRILRRLPCAPAILPGVLYHHERWDGTGYPAGLAGEEIPLFGRIIGVADAFDAMVSGRSYSGYLEQAAAVAELAGKTDLFDPRILEAFVSAHRQGKLTLRTETVVSGRDPGSSGG